MDSLGVWAAITEPQATIIAAVLTILAAVLGVSIGSWLFGGRVKDLKSALAHSEDALAQHATSVDATLSELRTKVGAIQISMIGLDEQFRTTTESLGQLQGSVSDIQDSSAQEDVPDDQVATMEALRDRWYTVRDKLESVAASENIDGRTRAKYARIDRRRYTDLIDALDYDDNLSGDSRRYQEAVAIWQKYRNGRRIPNAADFDMMDRLARELG